MSKNHEGLDIRPKPPIELWGVARKDGAWRDEGAVLVHREHGNKIHRVNGKYRSKKR